ncbi:MAG: ATP-binding protein [bacterium]
MAVMKRQKKCELSVESQDSADSRKAADECQLNSRSINQFGLLTITVAAIAICLILFLLYHYEKKIGEKQLIRDGFTLCSLIADLVRTPRMVEENFRNLNVLDYVVREKELLYCLVIDNKGIPLIQLGRQIPEEGVHNPGENAEEPDPIKSPEYLLTQRRIENQNGEVIYEFSKPIYVDGGRAGLVKIGLALSNYLHFDKEVSYLTGGIALSIFGLVFLFYYLLKRFFSPLSRINYHLRQMVREDLVAARSDNGNHRREFPRIEVSYNGEIGQLVEGVNKLLFMQQDKNLKLEESNAELEISNKILLYEKSRLRAILDNLKAGLIVIDSTGKAILANKFASHFLIPDNAKEEKQNFLGKPWKEFLRKANPDLGQMFSMFCGKENIYAHDFLEVHDSERETPLILCHGCSYLLNEEDKPLGFLWTITDITAQKQSESARHEFVNHVAHELKTPLNTLLSYSEMLLDGEVDDEQTKREFFNSINEEASRLSRLINNLLNISKIETGSLKIDRTLIKVDKLLKDCYQTVRAQAINKGINFSIDVADKMPNLFLDKDLIEVAILNLLTNAIKYTPAPGKVILQGIVEEEHVLIRVSDSGHGIPENEISRIFGKFFRSEREEIRKESGTGLGLSLAMNIVQLHKGDIKVESNLGVGSSFTIILPKEEVYI